MPKIDLTATTLARIVANTFAALAIHLNHEQITPILHGAASDLRTAAGIAGDLADLADAGRSPSDAAGTE
jgi:hypothetical protein